MLPIEPNGINCTRACHRHVYNKEIKQYGTRINLFLSSTHFLFEAQTRILFNDVNSSIV